MASTFDNSPAITSALSSSSVAEIAFYDKSLLFANSNKVINLIFSDIIMKKIAALTFSSIFGWLYVIIIFYGIITYIFAIANAVLLFLTAQIFISILFVLGPFFFLFLLFNQTKEMFDNDERIFRNFLKYRHSTIVVLDCGMGDHIVYNHVAKSIKNPEVFSCYPEIVPGRSIAEAIELFGDIDQFNVYKKMDQWNWKDSLENAFKKLYNVRN